MPTPSGTIRRHLLSALLLAGFAGTAFAHDPAMDESEKPDLGREIPKAEQLLGGSSGDVVIRCWRVETRLEGARRTTILTGNVELTRGDVIIKAENMVGWLEEPPAAAPGGEGGVPVEIHPGEPAAPEGPGVGVRFDEVYAEGHVRLARGEQQIEADRLYYSLRNDTALIYDAIIRIPARKLVPALTIRAKKVRRLGPDTLEAEDTSISTCSFGEPHYAINLKFLKVEFGQLEPQFEFDGLSPRFWGIPFFYWPHWSTIGFPGLPFRAIRYHKSGQYGQTIHSEWGMALHRNERDDDGNLVRDAKGRAIPRKWGDAWLNVDYFSKRGLGLGPTVEYHWGDYEGSAEAYWVRDRGPDPNRNYERQFLPLEKHDRGRFRTFHRHRLSDDWRLDIESSWLSDRHVLQEFYPDEFKEGKEQETYAMLRYRHENLGGTLIEKVRWNDFLDQTEYLPRAQAFLIGETFADGRLSYTARAEAANVRRQFDEGLDFPSFQIWRFDTEHELAAPVDFGFLTLRPFLDLRGTWFEENRFGEEDVSRGSAAAGLRAFTQISKVFTIHNDLLGLDDLRHVMEFEVRYADRFANSVPPRELVPFDQVDYTDRFDEVYLEWRNRLATRHGADRHSWEFLDATLAAEYYPDAERDTGRFRAQNFLSPFSWITKAPTLNGRFPRREWSNLHWDVRLTPETIFSFHTDGEWNWDRERIEVAAYGVSVDPSTRLSFAVWDRYVEEIAHVTSFDVAATLTDRWTARAQLQYDFRRRRLNEEKLTLFRDIHEFTLDLSFRVNESTGDTSFTFGISPSGLTARQRRY